jgi:hypothetical protein
LADLDTFRLKYRIPTRGTGHTNEPRLSRVRRILDQMVIATDGEFAILAADEYKLIEKW